MARGFGTRKSGRGAGSLSNSIIYHRAGRRSNRRHGAQVHLPLAWTRNASGMGNTVGVTMWLRRRYVAVLMLRRGELVRTNLQRLSQELTAAAAMSWHWQR